jgi:hypothetical protein
LGGPDEELSALMSEVAVRILGRGAEWAGERMLGAADIGCIDPNVAACASIRGYLERRGISTDELLTDTPERFQGLQRPVTIVRHPLSGKKRLTAFELSTGRWSVMLSRHMLFTVIVARQGIEETLRNHQQSSAGRTLGAENKEWQGWQAHMRIWRALKRLKRIVPVE